MTGIRRHNGTSWSNTPSEIRRHNGSSWTGGPGSVLSRHNGTSWVEVWRHPETVVGLTATAQDPNSIQLSWAGFSWASRYRLLWREVGLSWNSIILYLPSALIQGLDPETTYEFQVRAEIVYDTNTLAGGYSSTVQETTPQAGPDAPSLVTVSQVPGYLTSRLRVDYQDNSDNELGFRIHRNTIDDFASAVLVQTNPANSESWTDGTGQLEDGKRYYYWVTAYNDAGESTPVGAFNHTELAAITDLVASAGTDPTSQADLDWSNPSPNNASQIKVYLSDVSSSGPWTHETTVAGTDIQETLSTLAEGTQHWFHLVRTNSVAGDSAVSNVVTLTTTVSAPAAPQGVTVTALSKSSLRIAWQEVPDAAYYRIYGSTSSGFTPGPANLLQDNQSASPWDLTGLNIDETWFIVVTAVKTPGPVEGDPSTEASGTTWPEVPKSFNAQYDGTYLDFSWDNGTRSEQKTLQIYNFVADDWDPISSTIGEGVEEYLNYAYGSEHLGGLNNDRIDVRIKFNSESTWATDTVIIPV